MARNRRVTTAPPATELNEEPAIVVRKTSPALQLTPQDDQLMSKRGILNL
jgi:hypothetical protein